MILNTENIPITDLVVYYIKSYEYNLSNILAEMMSPPVAGMHAGREVALTIGRQTSTLSRAFSYEWCLK